MRKLITTMACLTIALLPNIACSDSNNDTIQEESLNKKERISNNKTYAKTASEVDAEYTYNSAIRLVDEIENNPTLLNSLRNPTKNPDGSIQYISETDFNHMLKFIDYEDNVDLSMVNKAVAEGIKAQELGAENYINGMDISSNAKAILLDMVTEEGIKNPSEYSEYATLNQSEKDALNITYSLTDRVAQNGPDREDVGIFMILACTATGAVIGGWIGAGVGLVVGIISSAIYKANH